MSPTTHLITFSILHHETHYFVNPRRPTPHFPIQLLLVQIMGRSWGKVTLIRTNYCDSPGERAPQGPFATQKSHILRLITSYRHVFLSGTRTW